MLWWGFGYHRFLFLLSRKDALHNLNRYLDTDMKIKRKVLIFGQKSLEYLQSQFHKPYIKKTGINTITYKNGFGKGTCSVIVGNRDLWEYIMMSLKYIPK